jgi:hypothetical protein
MKNSVTPPQTGWRNRIVGEGVEHPEQLLANPRNWRIHPKEQQAALTGMLEEVGWVQRVIVNKRTGFVVDGHMRVEVAISAGETEVPVLYVDLTEEEEAKVLATFDPISGMATMDAEKFKELVSEIEFASKDAEKAIASAADSAGVDVGQEKQEDNTYTNKIVAPVYSPKGEKPPVSALFDRAKTSELTAAIDAADLPAEVAEFLRFAAERHTVFNFRQIAEFYCHADKTTQDLMERSGLVIIDFNKAIENGFVHLTERLGELADLEEADNADA